MSNEARKKPGDRKSSPSALPAPGPVTRRAFFRGAGGMATAGALGMGPLLGAAEASSIGPLNASTRRNRSAQIRHDAEVFNKHLTLPDHPDNGDEDLYPGKLGSYSKGLPHNAFGEVNPAAYGALRAALSSGRPGDFEQIPMGCSPSVKLTNPQGGLGFDLEGTDSHQLVTRTIAGRAVGMRPAPAFASAEEAGEIAENYWMALLRDVNFLDYETSPLAAAAAADLSAMSDFRGLKQGGSVTPRTLFREIFPGCENGPYISQFMWLNTPFGAEIVSRKMRTLAAGVDYLTAYSAWLDAQNGCPPAAPPAAEDVRRYIRNGRDLGQWVHIDVLYQAYFNAMLIMLTPPDPLFPDQSGLGVPLNAGNPYNLSATQIGFGTFGGPHIAAITTEVATRALKAVWYQKWYVHRRLRPEAFAGRVHNHVTGARTYPIHPDILNSAALGAVFSGFGTYLLPMAFPEGSPTHPAYGAGHATVAGACVTILKALFNTQGAVIPEPVVPSPDGLTLLPYVGDPLTVEGELNKLAANVAIGRNIAGVHWRTDGTESMLLGEAVAISILRDQRATYNEDFGGFTFRKFDGTTVTV